MCSTIVVTSILNKQSKSNTVISSWVAQIQCRWLAVNFVTLKTEKNITHNHHKKDGKHTKEHFTLHQHRNNCT